jgi:hypothetical protein
VTAGRARAASLTDATVCLFASVVFCLLTLHDLRLPGPHTDELFTAAPAVNFVEGTSATAPMQIEPSVIRIAGRPLPLMVMTYVGALQTILYVPAFFVFGVSIETVRVLPVAIAILAIWISYLFWLELFNRPTAILATVFLLADPGFIFFAGRDFGPPALAMLCKMTGLLLLLRWWRGGSPWYLYGAAAVWGLGLYHKADFLWILAAAGMAAFVVRGGRIFTRLTWKTALGTGVVFVLTASPFLLMNLLSAGATFRLLAPHAGFGDQVSAFIAGIGTRASQVVDLMTGAAPTRLFMPDILNGAGAVAFLVPAIILGGFAALAAVSLYRAEPDVARRGRFLLLLVGLVFLASAKSPTSLMEHHLMALYPLLQGAAAAGIVLLVVRTMERGRAAVLSVAALLTAAPGFAATAGVYSELEATGGRGYWSDGVYDLARYLETEGKPVTLMQWGFTSNLIVLSRGRLVMHRTYKDLMERGIDPRVVEPYISPSALYLFYAPDTTGYRRTLGALTDAAARSSLVPLQVRLFRQHDGTPLYAVYQLRRSP